MKRAMALLLAAVALAPVAAAPALLPLPSDSVYQSNAQFTDAQSRRFAWSTMRGQPQLVSMFYTSCKFVCPMIVDSGKAIEQSLSAGERARLGVTLISLDPKHDTPAVLARMRLQRDLDSARWTLARPDPQDVRAIAGLLGIRYRALADGEFNHTTVLVLLDADGRVIARTERVGGLPDPAFLAAVRRTLVPHSVNAAASGSGLLLRGN
jgi:protein SCO1/2